MNLTPLQLFYNSGQIVQVLIKLVYVDTNIIILGVKKVSKLKGVLSKTLMLLVMMVLAIFATEGIGHNISNTNVKTGSCNFPGREKEKEKITFLFLMKNVPKYCLG